MADFKPEFVDRPSSARRWRRVVTGETNGKSGIAIDDAACPYQMAVSGTGIVVTELWRTDANPVAFDPKTHDTCKLPLAFGPPTNGTTFQILEWPPDNLASSANRPDVGKATASKQTATTMHQTPTIEYIVVMSGEIWAVMEEGETRLRSGDTLIQRGTKHAWSNRSAETCVMLVVMISARC